jgi:hypothetical protein
MLQVLKEPAATILDRAAGLDSSSILTGSALYWLRRIARQNAWDRWHAQSCQNREPLQVTESTVIRGQTVEVRLFISRYGATYCTRWRVDGHPWTQEQVNQSFGF